MKNRKKALIVSMFPLEYNTSATIQNKGIIMGLYEEGFSVDTLTIKPEKSFIGYDASMNDISNILNKKYYLEISSIYKRFMSTKTNVPKHNNEKGKKTILNKVKTVIKDFIQNIIVYDMQILNVFGKKIKHIKEKINWDDYEIILSTSDPKTSHVLASRLLSKNNNKPYWIQYWGDPMYNDITRKSSWNNSFVKFKEKNLLKSADSVVYASPLTLELQKSSFPEFKNKMIFASQIANLPYSDLVKTSIYENDHSKVDIGYFGSYNSEIRNITPFYKWALNNHDRVLIAGNSDLGLREANHISIFGSLGYEAIIELENKVDILVCIANKRGTQIPGKIYYTASYNKPIIVILDGDYKEEIRKYLITFNRYILCENTEESINSAVLLAKEELNNKTKYNIDRKLKVSYFGKAILSSYREKFEENN